MRQYKSNHLTEEHRELLKAYIKNNPDSTYTRFVNDIKGKVKCSDAHYYSVKRELGIVSTKRSYVKSSGEKIPRSSFKSPLYMTVWSCPIEKCPETARKVLEDFISTMNGLRRSRFEVIEMKNPAVIEVRETHIRG
jgi:hypothetical protein